MSDIDTNDPTDETVTADPASADDGVPTDDNALDAAEADAPADVDEPAEGTDDESPADDETTEARGVESAEGGDAEGGASTEAIDVDELLEQSVVVDNPYTRPGRWFVVHTQSGYEKKVKQNLEARIHSMNAEEAVYEVVIPMEDYVDFKNGKRVVNQRKMFPGYLLVRAELDDTAWFVIRNTPGVTGFVGQGAKPSPLPRRDVEAFLMPKGGDEQVATRAKPRLEYEMGETVRVKEGPFADFSGEVIELNEDQLKLKVLVNIFGRETPVELEFSKVAKL
jgi:transcription termination/antitermination protein NusG